MPKASDAREFRNDQLVLRVSETVNPAVWNEDRYEAFFDALCEGREYQKDALRTTLRYLLGGRYQNLRHLAEENLAASDDLKDRYGSIEAMEGHLLFPDHLYATVDLATGTGKSYLLYGIAAVLLAEGAVDRVLVLCPSNTIETGLLEKFRILAGTPQIAETIPAMAKVKVPRIIRADETIEPGCICVENYHAVLGHVRSSIRDSLTGKGKSTLVLNDEVHHVAGVGGQDLTKWREFLADPAFGFHRIIGVSGTCYNGDDYFGDVISRYSLRTAIEDGTVKDIDYVTEADIGSEEAEERQIIYENHKRNKTKYRQVKPLTIFVTRDIKACEQRAEEWVDFLAEHEGIEEEEAGKKVLVVTSSDRHVANLAALQTVDTKASPVEWIFSVSMLTEGWDVKNVFQIVPSEERAFNSKLLIAQVLGRGLRIPPQYHGQKPSVIVFNHDAWSKGIKRLVEEVLEIEKRISSRVTAKTPDYNFDLHQIDYSRKAATHDIAETKGSDVLTKGYVELPSQAATINRTVHYERATTGESSTRKTTVQVKMYSVEQVAGHIYKKLLSIDHESAAEAEECNRTAYATQYPLEWCEKMVRVSVERVGETEGRVSEENRQKILQALGPLQAGATKSVQYESKVERVVKVSTKSRPATSTSYHSLRRGEATIFFTPDSRASFEGEELAVFDEVADEESEVPKKSVQKIANAFHFKTALNVVLTDHDPERKFVRKLCEGPNAEKLDAWIKSSDRDFYSIEFTWKKGEHTKRGSFNPDFFLKIGNRIYVVEIKDDGQIKDPSEENKMKYKFAREHFANVNAEQTELVYQFNFLSPQDYDVFFQKLCEGTLEGYQSHLDVPLMG